MVSCLTRTDLHLCLQYCAASWSSWILNALTLRQEPAHCHILSTATSPIIFIISFSRFNGYDLIWIIFYWLDSTQEFWRDSTQFLPTRSEPMFSTGFDSVFPPRFESRFFLDLNQVFGLIWLMFNAFIFYSIHIIWLTFQPGSRSPKLDKVY